VRTNIQDEACAVLFTVAMPGIVKARWLDG